MFEEALKKLPPVRVLDLTGPAAKIDLSPTGPHAGTDLTDDYMSAVRKELGAAYLAGGYAEKREIYRRSMLFGDERNVHVGIDLWAAAGARVLAPLQGSMHSFDYNAGIGNYGPTIILEHKIDNFTFYALYGHLSAKDLEELETGMTIAAGEAFAHLGTRAENGDYAPHLHFQLIRELEGHAGDYPGVCRALDLPKFLANCPDPKLLLKIDL